MWQELMSVLKELSQAYAGLLKLSQQKRTALVGIDLPQLDALLKEEEKIVARIQTAENRRRSILMKLSKTQPDLRPDADMKELYACAPQDVQPLLTKLHEGLSAVIDRVKEAGDNNRLLIDGALSAVHYQLNRLGGSVVEPAYGTRGQEIVSKEKKFDFQA